MSVSFCLLFVCFVSDDDDHAGVGDRGNGGAECRQSSGGGDSNGVGANGGGDGGAYARPHERRYGRGANDDLDGRLQALMRHLSQKQLTVPP